MADPPDKLSPDKLSVVLHSGAFDRVHYALVLAAAAAATNRLATLFFTQWACRALLRPTAGRDGEERPGWQALTVGEPGIDAAALDARFVAQGIGGFEELLQACASLGVRFLVCESGLAGAGLAAGDLRDDLPIEIAGAVTFLQDASATGATLFV